MRGLPGTAPERDALLILVLFQAGLHISEALSLTVGHLNRQPGVVEIVARAASRDWWPAPPP